MSNLVTRKWMRRAAIVVATISVVGCDGKLGVTGPGGIGVVTGGPQSSVQGLVGSWRRSVFFLDGLGIARSSETTWRFSGDGTAVRVLVTRNFTDLIGDTQVATARFRVEGTRLRLEYLTPSPGTVDLDLRIEGTSLFLGGQQFLRVTE